ncbi:hypothetical protein C0J52_07733 [Blattella germanica]|nr:hypothetical protein C0J52_07733 [Blattella germanica]
MTVQYMHKLHKQKSEPEKSKTTASTALQKNPKFRAGFSECAREARNLLGRLEGVDSAVQERLSNHLASCLEPLENATVLTLLPTKLPNGDLAFVIPANLKNSMAACVRTETRTANKPEEGPLQEDAVWRPW